MDPISEQDIADCQRKLFQLIWIDFTDEMKVADIKAQMRREFGQDIIDATKIKLCL